MSVAWSWALVGLAGATLFGGGLATRDAGQMVGGMLLFAAAFQKHPARIVGAVGAGLALSSCENPPRSKVSVFEGCVAMARDSDTPYMAEAIRACRDSALAIDAATPGGRAGPTPNAQELLRSAPKNPVAHEGTAA